MSVIRQRLLVLAVLAVASIALFVPSSASAAPGDDCVGTGLSYFEGTPYVYVSSTLAEARANGYTKTVTFECEGVIDSVVVDPGVLAGQADFPDDGDIDLATTAADPSVITVEWTPRPADLTAGRPFDNFYNLQLLDDNDVVVENISVTFEVSPQFDVTGSITAPTSAQILPAGSTTNVPVTGTLTNPGPDTAFDKSLIFTLENNVTPASLPAGCEGLVQPDRQYVFCGQVDLAPGQSVSRTISLAYQPGVKGLVLPSTATVTFSNYGESGGESGELNPGNNTATAKIALVAATCAAGQTGTPPNCVTPTTNTPTTGNDTLFGTIGPDFVRAGSGDDRVSGGAGNDTLFGETGNDTLFGGIGNDSVSGGEGNDLVDGGAGNDKLTGNSGNDKIGGGAGNDAVDGGSGNDRILGGVGSDKLAGGSGNDTIICGSGTDVASGGAGNDKIGCKDGSGGDVINGGGGNDACYGDANDRFISCEKITRV